MGFGIGATDPSKNYKGMYAGYFVGSHPLIPSSPAGNKQAMAVHRTTADLWKQPQMVRGEVCQRDMVFFDLRWGSRRKGARPESSR